jgi:hypothetical protein
MVGDHVKGFIQVYLHYHSHCIILCLLFIVGDFLLFVIFYEGVCDRKMLVLLYVFIGLCFMRQILNLWVFDVCQRQFMMWKLLRCNEENLREAYCWNMHETKHISFEPLRYLFFFQCDSNTLGLGPNFFWNSFVAYGGLGWTLEIRQMFHNKGTFENDENF